MCFTDQTIARVVHSFICHGHQDCLYSMLLWTSFDGQFGSDGLRLVG